MIIKRIQKRELKSTRNWTDLAVLFQQAAKSMRLAARQINRVLRRTSAKLNAIVGKQESNRRIRKALRRGNWLAVGYHRHQRLVRLGL